MQPDQLDNQRTRADHEDWLESKIDHVVEGMRKEFASERRWMIGLLFANTVATFGVLVKSFHT